MHTTQHLFSFGVPLELCRLTTTSNPDYIRPEHLGNESEERALEVFAMSRKNTLGIGNYLL